MGTQLWTVQQTLKLLKGVEAKVNYLKRVRHKSTDKSIKEYCTKQIARITSHARISKQRFYGGEG